MKTLKILFNTVRNLYSKNISVGKMSGYKVWKCLKCDNKSNIITKNISVRKNSHIEAKNGGKIEIGNNTNFNYNNIIISHNSIKIGENCLLGPNVTIYDHDHNYKDNDWRNKFVSTPVIIGNNVWIGANVTILRGTTIGDNCVIGAGTILKGKIVKENTIVFSKIELVEKERDLQSDK